MNTLVGIKENVKIFCIKFIKKTLSSSLPVDVGLVWPNHIKPSCYFSFVLVLLLCFINFLLQVLHIAMVSQRRSRSWAHNSWCHNSIVGVVSIIDIRA